MPADGFPEDDLVGVMIAGRYRIISRLGAGGMGTAYRAWDEQAGVPVVIKIPRRTFLEDPKFAERFRREILLLRGLVHPHIVPIMDDGEHEGLPFVVMRFLPGGSLSNRRLRDENSRVKPNPPGMLHLWLPAVADALDAIHADGVVHRDMKPANIFFDAGWGAFVGDFGIAKIVAESEAFDKEHTLTATGMGIGTPDYMAPEQFTPKVVVDGRADQYSLAVIVYEMLAGVRPFTGETSNLIVEVMTQPAPRLDEKRAGLAASLVAAVDRGLAKHPPERFATCREFAAAVLRDVPPLDAEPGVARLLCPKCANLLKLPESAAGRTGKCPKCKSEMKVAADLGAMWLLDEARRQEEASGGGWTALGGNAPGGGPGSESSLETLRAVSDTTPIGKAARGSRGGVVAWIDGHGLIVGGALALAALVPLLLRATTSVPVPSTGDEAAVQGSKAAGEAIATELANVRDLEVSLQRRLDASRIEEQGLRAEVARLRSTPPPGPAEPPPTQVVDGPPQDGIEGERGGLTSSGTMNAEQPRQAVAETEPSAPDQEADAALATLKTNPLDKVANGMVGRQRCFKEQDWDQGLVLLARGDREDLAGAARAELLALGIPLETGASDSSALDSLGTGQHQLNPGAVILAAKQWWSLAARAEFAATESSAAMRKHAAELYSRHVTSLTTTLDKEFATAWLESDAEFRALVKNKRAAEPGTGLWGEYFVGTNLDPRRRMFTQVDPELARDYKANRIREGFPTSNFSIRWSGSIRPERSDTYTFVGYSDDGVRIKVDGKMLLDEWRGRASPYRSQSIAMEAGKDYPIVIEYCDYGKGNAKFYFDWQGTDVAKQRVPTQCLYPPKSRP